MASGLDFSYLLHPATIELPDPVRQATAAMTLAQAVQSGQLNKLKLQQEQQEMGAKEAYNAARGTFDLNDPQAVKQAYQTLPPEARPYLLKDYLDNQKATADAAEKKAQAGNYTSQTRERDSKLASGLAGFWGEKYSKAETPEAKAAVVQAAQAEAQRAGFPDLFRAPDGVDQGDLFGAVAARGIDAAKRADLAGQAEQRTTTAGHYAAQDANSAATLAENKRAHDLTDARERERIGIERQRLGGTGVPGAGGDGTGLTGDDFLKSLDPATAGTVKAIAEGRMALPTGSAMRSPQVQRLVGLVSQYDPSFDASLSPSRVATRKDFTAGKSAQTINALNTVVGHLDELDKSGAALNNTDYPAINWFVNKYRDATGDPRPGTFRANQTAVADELERAYRQSGGTESEIQAMKADISANASDAQRNAVLSKYVSLLGSKIGALDNQYKRGMGTNASLPPELLDPHTVETLGRLGNGSPDSSSDGPPSRSAQKVTSSTTKTKGAISKTARGYSVQTPDGASFTFPTESSAFEFMVKAGMR